MCSCRNILLFLRHVRETEGAKVRFFYHSCFRSLMCKPSKAELQREITALRNQLMNLQTGLSKISTSGQDSDRGESLSSMETAVKSCQCNSTLQSSMVARETQFTTFTKPKAPLPTVTTRKIDAVCVESIKVKDCFALYVCATMISLFTTS